jgi:DNA-binding NarL/FixJ family response regulator
LLVSPDAMTRQLVDGLLRVERSIMLLPDVLDDSYTLVIVERSRPDVLLIETAARERALQLVRGVSTLSRGTKTLLLQKRPDAASVERFLAWGGSGCVDVHSTDPDLVRALHVVHAGELWASRRAVASALRQALKPFEHPSSRDGLQQNLSKREREIVEWMRCGMTNKEIARKLGISDMTVKTHAHNIFNKLEVSGRVRLLGLTSATSRREQTEHLPDLNDEMASRARGANGAPSLKPAA